MVEQRQHREAVRAEPRPSQLLSTSEGLIEAALKAQISDLETTWRVYGLAWLREWTASVSGDAPEASAECVEVFDRRFRSSAGGCRVYQKHWRVRFNEFSGRFVLEICRYNLFGEWKHKEDAVAHREELETAGGEIESGSLTLVRKGSRDEVALLGYGKKMMREAL